MDEITNKGIQPGKLQELKAFFPEDDLEWLPKVVWKKNGTYGVRLCPYINRAAVMDRLDSVCGPQNWVVEYVPGPGGGIVSKLSIRIDGEWITKCDGAENTKIESIKGGISGALKRAATTWNIGRYLAFFPKVFGIINLKAGKLDTFYEEKLGNGKKGKREYFNYDPPPVPGKWLPPTAGDSLQTAPKEWPKQPEEIDEKKRIKEEIEATLKKIAPGVLPEKQANWLTEKLKSGFTEKEATRALSGLKEYLGKKLPPPAEKITALPPVNNKGEPVIVVKEGQSDTGTSYI